MLTMGFVVFASGHMPLQIMISRSGGRTSEFAEQVLQMWHELNFMVRPIWAPGSCRGHLSHR